MAGIPPGGRVKGRAPAARFPARAGGPSLLVLFATFSAPFAAGTGETLGTGRPDTAPTFGRCSLPHSRAGAGRVRRRVRCRLARPACDGTLQSGRRAGSPAAVNHQRP